ncbi:hypothetical protein QJS04_geneDACA009852 [Acorus gramineus]|uniref:Uncharacterized protein n=1 Tax=Acorus gramineus TaxID=55184 RepID=A0AAV9B857_ACOGR|nr:hypothetical protein QJS04_geneDACA009852 [Acorus gramineus]
MCPPSKCVIGFLQLHPDRNLCQSLPTSEKTNQREREREMAYEKLASDSVQMETLWTTLN